MAKRLPEFIAVQKWLDNKAEIDVKKTLVKMMTGLKIPALVIRDVQFSALSALKDLGLKVPGGMAIDLVMAYVSGDSLHVVILEGERFHSRKSAFFCTFFSTFYSAFTTNSAF